MYGPLRSQGRSSRNGERTWEETDLYRVDIHNAARPFFNLMEFPYPSGEGLHVGHVYTYCGADTYGRFQRMHGYDVFQPMGFDSFGIHTENYALKVGENPMTLTDQTVHRFRETQMKRLGAMWDWSHEVVTSHPDYYKWTQWIFLQIYKAGLAYRATAPVTWCPSCLTVLAAEQTEKDDKTGETVCERCGTPTVQREMEQWFFRITAYADRLVDGLRDLDWPELSKVLQSEWIGRSEGAEITFADRRQRTSLRRASPRGPIRCSARPTPCWRPSIRSWRRSPRPQQRDGGRGLRGRGAQQDRARAHRRGRQGEDRRLHRRLRRQPRHGRDISPSGSPTTC